MRIVPFILGVCISLASCRVQQSARQPSANQQDHLLMAAAFVQHAAEYRALCYQAYNAASLQLINPDNLAIPQRAIVLDLDETVLDNSPYTGWQILHQQSYSGESWQRWTALAAADTVPGAGYFLHMADSLGYSLFYVSNRKVAELEATMENMKVLGLPQVEENHFLLRTNTSNKIPRRQQIEEQGFQIVLLVGDNACDLDGNYEEASQEERQRITDSMQHEFGRRLIILPNPVYGSWEGALINSSADDSQQDKQTRLKARLQSF